MSSQGEATQQLLGMDDVQDTLERECALCRPLGPSNAGRGNPQNTGLGGCGRLTKLRPRWIMDIKLQAGATCKVSLQHDGFESFEAQSSSLVVVLAGARRIEFAVAD